MISRAKIPAMLFLALAATMIAGCGGGSGGGDGSSGGGLTLLSGLDGDADNHDILYFSGNYEQQGKSYSTLYAVSPSSTNNFYGQHLSVQEDNRSPEELARALYRPLYESVIDENDGSVQDYRVSDVLFLHNRESGNATSEGFARATTDAAATIGNQMGVRFSGESYLGAPNLDGAGVLIRQNYIDADQVEISYGLPGNKKLARTSYSISKLPASVISSVIKYVTPFANIASDSDSFAYLALRDDDAVLCNGFHVTRASSSGSGANGNVVANYLPVGKEASDVIALGGPLSDGTAYVVVNVVNQADCTSEASLWRFSPGAPASLILTPVLNSNDEPLIIPAGIAGGPMMPAARHVAQQGDVLYFGITGALGFGPQDLYRVDGNSWSLLAEQEDSLGYYTGFIVADEGRVAASVGNKVVSWAENGSDRQELDESSAAWLGIMTEVIGSRDGWIFYNRADITGQDNAVAMKIDGSDSQIIPNAQWFGASITGNGESINGINELSEVFLWRDRDIGAVSAADPTAGMVLLGRLGSAPDNVVMYGLAPGPHRLIQVFPSGEDEGRVYYVNTRNADSLRAMTVGSPIGHQRPVDGF